MLAYTHYNHKFTIYTLLKQRIKVCAYLRGIDGTSHGCQQNPLESQYNHCTLLEDVPNGLGCHLSEACPQQALQCIVINNNSNMYTRAILYMYKHADSHFYT